MQLRCLGVRKEKKVIPINQNDDENVEPGMFMLVPFDFYFNTKQTRVKKVSKKGIKVLPIF